MRFLLYEMNEQYVETATIPLVVAGLALAVGGWHLLRVALPVGRLPVLHAAAAAEHQPALRSRSRAGDDRQRGALQIIGLPVMAEGNVIIVGADAAGSRRACNGLSMLLSFVTLITATVILVRRPPWERRSCCSARSRSPWSATSSGSPPRRSATTASGQEAGDKIAHDLAGWMMMPLALVLVWLELRVMSWLFVEVEEIDAGR